MATEVKHIEITKGKTVYFVTAICENSKGITYQRNLCISKSLSIICKFTNNIKHIEQSLIQWKDCAGLLKIAA